MTMAHLETHHSNLYSALDLVNAAEIEDQESRLFYGVIAAFESEDNAEEDGRTPLLDTPSSLPSSFSSSAATAAATEQEMASVTAIAPSPTASPPPVPPPSPDNLPGNSEMSSTTTSAPSSHAEFVSMAWMLHLFQTASLFALLSYLLSCIESIATWPVSIHVATGLGHVSAILIFLRFMVLALAGCELSWLFYNHGAYTRAAREEKGVEEHEREVGEEADERRWAGSVDDSESGRRTVERLVVPETARAMVVFGLFRAALLCCYAFMLLLWGSETFSRIAHNINVEEASNSTAQT